MLTGRLQRLQSAWSAIDRYSTAVRSAIVGIEDLPGIDQRGAAELNTYADQIDDIEHRLHERYQWGADTAQSSAVDRKAPGRADQSANDRFADVPADHLFDGLFRYEFRLDDQSSVIVTVLWLKRRGLV
jgi:hypothetical protein